MESLEKADNIELQFFKDEVKWVKQKFPDPFTPKNELNRLFVLPHQKEIQKARNEHKNRNGENEKGLGRRHETIGSH